MRIALFGTVGAGKSTVSERISQALGHEIFPEPIEDNPYFDKYYKDMKAYAFQMQVYMLSARSKQLSNAFDKNDIIFDRTILEDPIFMKVLNQTGMLNDVDYSTLIDFFENIVIPSLGERARFDVVIYLRVSSEKAFERVKTRGKVQELDVKFDFWDKLNKLYDEAYEQRKNKFKFLVIDADNDNLDEKVDFIIDKLKKGDYNNG